VEKGGNILVGTPGRLDQFLQHTAWPVEQYPKLGACEVLILDEADRYTIHAYIINN
jgi:superfamily II DNA/RNA helicase